VNGDASVHVEGAHGAVGLQLCSLVGTPSVRSERSVFKTWTQV
jgi:hypothetical protein